MQLLIAETEDLPLSSYSFKTNEYSMLRSIVQAYLWHEPHLFIEMAFPANSQPSPVLRKQYRRRIVSVLKKSIAAGLVRRENGFFYLTSPGRTEMARRFEFDDGLF